MQDSRTTTRLFSQSFPLAQRYWVTYLLSERSLDVQGTIAFSASSSKDHTTCAHNRENGTVIILEGFWKLLFDGT